ncbi:putative glycolipid-binding domain-containing protein [Nakamurella aerolata]|uniref:Uncharacterized protein n=1 Tax=Nakamurella aerolata TaxID=1656892 RepID=A0A849AEG2_9ACTN|nr:hypothetical protein [Nakamurella aerolata]
MTRPVSASLFTVPAGAPGVAETARLVFSDRGLRANGYLLSDQFGSWYSLMADSTSALRRLTVRADSALGERSLTLTSAPGSPWVAERADGGPTDPALTDDADVLLVGSAAMLALPLARRLATDPDALPADGSQLQLPVTEVTVPELTVQQGTVDYRRLPAADDLDGTAAELVDVVAEHAGRAVRLHLTTGGSGLLALAAADNRTTASGGVAAAAVTAS